MSAQTITSKIPRISRFGAVVIVSALVVVLTGSAGFGSYATFEETAREGQAIESIETHGGGPGLIPAVLVNLGSPAEEIGAVHLIGPDGRVVDRETHLTGASSVALAASEIKFGNQLKAVAVGHNGENLGYVEFTINHHWPWEDGLP